MVEDRTAVLVVLPGKVYSHGADSYRMAEDKTAVFVVPGKVYLHGEDSQWVVQDRTAVSQWSQKRFVYSHGADSQRIVKNKMAVFVVIPRKVYSHWADS
jgi:hypothetical protein